MVIKSYYISYEKTKVINLASPINMKKPLYIIGRRIRLSSVAEGAEGGDEDLSYDLDCVDEGGDDGAEGGDEVTEGGDGDADFGDDGAEGADEGAEGRDEDIDADLATWSTWGACSTKPCGGVCSKTRTRELSPKQEEKGHKSKGRKTCVCIYLIIFL